MDQPLDFSVKSPFSPGSDSFCSLERDKRRSNNIVKDDNYWVRREKNNAAAKRSRDARRQKEEQTKHENQILRRENEDLKFRIKRLEGHLLECPYGSGRSWKTAVESEREL